MSNLKLFSNNCISYLIKYSIRNIGTSSSLYGKRNFRKFLVLNKRGTRIFKEQQKIKPHPKIPIDKRGVRDTGFVENGEFKEIPEKIPLLVVPDLKDCKLKPYVSYKAPEVVQPEFTSIDLFNAIYANKIVDDFAKNKLDISGNPLEPTEEEKLTPEEAWINARKCGSDLF
ncbi:39S ribosomal protein L41, mitochondrial [Condylostylus longicornis]|uniref:39S ribosomal protein L41, mitochondrial n=1 Tax=Condylostylus longicornis TaxID=2530218 RepID=UPI00244E1E7D|nr:39S ribosomal protein L41, mitochondrial [Condylostylus longicornis]